MRRERKIDARQRVMERTIRKWKTRGFCAENKDFARAAFLRARQWEKEYEKYSRENGRAFFPNRTRVMRNEIAYYKAIKRLWSLYYQDKLNETDVDLMIKHLDRVQIGYSALVTYAMGDGMNENEILDDIESMVIRDFGDENVKEISELIFNQLKKRNNY